MTTAVKFVEVKKFKKTCHIKGLLFTKENFNKDDNYKSYINSEIGDIEIYQSEATGRFYQILDLDETSVALFPVEIVRE